MNLIKSISLIVFIILLSNCENGNKTTIPVKEITTPIKHPDTSATKTEAIKGDTIKTIIDRKKIIKELRRLQEIFKSNDKAKIADLFGFPISNNDIGIFIENDDFNKQLEKNNNQISKSMFTRHYNDISAFLQIDQLNQLFKKLNLDDLLHQDQLEQEAIIKTQPCYHYYGVKIENNLVTLTLGTNSNKSYKNKAVPEGELPENDGAICELVYWWVFAFDGKQLHFKQISGAG